MKIIAILIFTLIIPQFLNAQQTCETYINDEWQDTRYNVEVLSGDNVVTDNRTKLMWKQCSQGLSGSDCNTGIIKTPNWQQAQDLASSEDFAEFTDWRVPNLKELRTIVARNCYSPSINENIFPNTPSIWFWSSSPSANNDDNAWVVHFINGGDDLKRRNTGYRLRLVRSLEQ